jgi:hypothetical protein
MKTWIIAASMAGAVLSWAGCQQSSSFAQATAPPIDVCSLLSAAEVSAIMGKPVVQSPHSCDYGLDPAAKQKALADAGVKPGGDDFQNMAAMMRSLAEGGRGAVMKTTETMMEQLTVSVGAERDGMTEAQAKAVYAKVAGPVHGALNGVLNPEAHNANDVIQAGTEISGVGEWAFTTNVATVNLPGSAIRGRLLQAGKGPWHITVSVTVSPDPGTEVLDRQLAGLARALAAKL